jgi:hypothetical protein
MISETIDDVIKDIEEMIVILNKPEVTSLMTEERAIGARIAYKNCLLDLKTVIGQNKMKVN